ncbi:MAG TPA: hypothetical protein VK612_08570 [Pyrinomonadaceae bacterium]|nr:hypothetical protein [Pyrinomonadaceae bacterium]
MKNLKQNRDSERGSAGVKFLMIFFVLVLAAHAGYNYIPVAYQGASLRQEMDTAVVKGLAASGRLKPAEVVAAHIQKAIVDNNIPSDAVIEIIPLSSVIQARVTYQKKVNMLPFGIYKYNYDFNYTAAPQGYLLKD